MNIELMEKAFSKQSIKLPHHDQLVDFEVIKLGDLVIKSGQLVAADPFTILDVIPFTDQVPLGIFPVDCAIALFGKKRRSAFSRVKFTNNKPARWKMALTAEQDPSSLIGSQFFGYGVDSGVGCFADIEAANLLIDRINREEEYSNNLSLKLFNKSFHAWSWINEYPDPSKELNVLCFYTGLGDGAYPSYFGLSESGNIVSLITDFGIVYDQNDLDNWESQDREAQKIRTKK
jgi:hypothetical protein